MLSVCAKHLLEPMDAKRRGGRRFCSGIFLYAGSCRIAWHQGAEKSSGCSGIFAMFRSCCLLRFFGVVWCGVVSVVDTLRLRLSEVEGTRLKLLLTLEQNTNGIPNLVILVSY